SGRTQHIAFHRVAVEHDVEGLGLHHDLALGDSDAFRCVLAGDVDHPRLAAFAQMRELGGRGRGLGFLGHSYLAASAGTRSRFNSARVAAVTSRWRIRLSPTRNVWMPTAVRRARSSGV